MSATALEPGRGTMFGWDWRKAPEMPPAATLDKLDKAVDDALARPGKWKDQGAGRVVLWGHSYGGLLIRAYLEKHPEKVARVLTVGTPFRGAPKALFPLAFGIESPEIGAMDFLFRNSSLKTLAVDLGGLYQLYPSRRYPAGWLSVDGAPADLASFVAELGGNTTQLTLAQLDHTSIYDRFDDNHGKIDVKAVVGTGVPTFGTLAFTRLPDREGKVKVTYVNGDGTVPGVSGTQGPTGGSPDPPSAQIHIQNTCGVEHVALANDRKMIEAYDAWLESGRTPRKLARFCHVFGSVYEFAPGTLGVTKPAWSQWRAQDAADAPMTLRDAEDASLVDVVDLPEGPLVVTDDWTPVTLSVPLTGTSFTYAPITDAGEGAALTYGPLTGEVQLVPPAEPGGAPVVLLDGAPVAPQEPAPEPTPVGGTPPPEAGPPAPGPAAPGPPAAQAPSNRFRLAGRPSRRGSTIRMAVRLPGPGRLQVRATIKQGRKTLAAGRAKKTVRAAGRVRIALRLSRPAPKRVSLALTYTPVGGAARTVRAKVAAPRK